MEKRIQYIIVGIILFLAFSCEKEITVDIPDAPQKLVVDGSIETGGNPFIILTKTTGYFDPTDIETIAATFVGDAEIKISDGTNTFDMTKICSSSLPPDQVGPVSESLGIDSNLLKAYNICAYTHPLTGEEGKSYTIDISWEGESYSSTTTIPQAIPLDSTWFKIQGNLDSLGFLWAILSDPQGLGNAYHWRAKRINKYTYGELAGQVKDNDFMTPSNPVFDDNFFDGLSFDFAYDRPRSGRDRLDEENGEAGYYKIGDTVAIKFSTIDIGVYNFIDQAAIQSQSNGSPFASPINITSNVSNGAVGLWAGYGFSHDTIICQ